VPDGITVGPVTSAMCDYMKAEWYWGKRSGAEEYIKTILAYQPSMCLYDSSGEPLSYELTYFFGCMGMLHTKPDHRGHGLARLVVSLLTRKMLDEGQIPYATTHYYNETSIRMHAKLGFEALGIFDWYNCKAPV
jgi:GNAT superfamily N-acetyltransferase